jgi:hypothetical protein
MMNLKLLLMPRKRPPLMMHRWKEEIRTRRTTPHLKKNTPAVKDQDPDLTVPTLKVILMKTLNLNKKAAEVTKKKKLGLKRKETLRQSNLLLL